MLIRILAVTTVCTLVFANSVTVPFIFDDAYSITENGYIRQLWPLTNLLSAPPAATVAGRPMVSLTLAINYAIHGYEPAGYHIGNILLHILNALLLAALIERVLKMPRFAENITPTAARWLATAVALVWAVHPLNSEAIVHTIQRTELLVSHFLLLALWTAAKGFDQQASGNKTSAAIWLTVSILSSAFGMASKEIMYAAPLLVLLYDRTLVAGTFLTALRQRTPYYIFLAATYFILLILNINNPRGNSVGFAFGINAFENLCTQAQVITWYLRLMFWPIPLTIAYDWPIVRDLLDALPQGLFILALLIATGVALWRNMTLGLLGAWFFLILAPTSSFIPIPTEVAAERRTYLPSAAIFSLTLIGGLMLCQTILSTGKSSASLKIMVSIIIAILLTTGLSIMTWVRIQDYQTEESIWRNVVKQYPHFSTALSNLGKSLLPGRPEEASRLFEQVLNKKPNHVESLNNLAQIYASRGNSEQALPMLARAAEIKPDDAHFQNNYGAVLAQVGRIDEARQHFLRALKINSYSADAHANLALLYAKLGRIDRAFSHSKKALELEPQHKLANHLMPQLIAYRQGTVKE